MSDPTDTTPPGEAPPTSAPEVHEDDQPLYSKKQMSAAIQRRLAGKARGEQHRTAAQPPDDQEFDRWEANYIASASRAKPAAPQGDSSSSLAKSVEALLALQVMAMTPKAPAPAALRLTSREKLSNPTPDTLLRDWTAADTAELANEHAAGLRANGFGGDIEAEATNRARREMIKSFEKIGHHRIKMTP